MTSSGFFPSSSSFNSPYSSSSSRMRWDEGALAEGVATKSGWVSGVPSGIGMPSGTMNPS